MEASIKKKDSIKLDQRSDQNFDPYDGCPQMFLVLGTQSGTLDALFLNKSAVREFPAVQAGLCVVWMLSLAQFRTNMGGTLFLKKLKKL